MLMRQRRFRSGPALDLQIVEIVFDEPIAPETFVFEPPPGLTMNDVEERRRVDTLTGLANRREVEAWLNGHCRRADLRNEALSVALIDIDDMRTINDSYGSSIGDLSCVASPICCGTRRARMTSPAASAERSSCSPGLATTPMKPPSRPTRYASASAR